MQDFETPFNPLANTPIQVQTPDGQTTNLRPGCCGNVCSPDCVVAPEERAPTQADVDRLVASGLVEYAGTFAKDTDLVTLQIPTDHVPLPPDQPGRPICDPEFVTPENPKGECGEDRSGTEVLTPFTLTVGQLKNLVIGRIFLRGNYADTRAEMRKVREALDSNES